MRPGPGFKRTPKNVSLAWVIRANPLAEKSKAGNFLG